MKPAKKKKNISIDDLALIVARGFETQEKTLDKKLEGRFSKQEKRIEERFLQQEKWIERGFEHQVKWIEGSFAQQERRFDELDKKYENIMNGLERCLQ